MKAKKLNAHMERIASNRAWQVHLSILMEQIDTQNLLPLSNEHIGLVVLFARCVWMAGYDAGHRKAIKGPGKLKRVMAAMTPQKNFLSVPASQYREALLCAAMLRAQTNGRRQWQIVEPHRGNPKVVIQYIE